MQLLSGKVSHMILVSYVVSRISLFESLVGLIVSTEIYVL